MGLLESSLASFSGLDSKSLQFVGLLLEEAVALIYLPSTQLCDQLISLPTPMVLSRGLECMFKPLSAQCSNLVELAITLPSPEPGSLLDSIVHIIPADLSSAVRMVARSRCRVIMVFGTDEQALRGLTFIKDIAYRQKLYHLLSARMVPLEELSVARATVQSAGRVPLTVAAVSAALDRQTANERDSPLVLAIHPSNADNDSQCYVLTANEADVRAFQALHSVDLDGQAALVPAISRPASVRGSPSAKPTAKALLVW